MWSQVNGMEERQRSWPKESLCSHKVEDSTKSRWESLSKEAAAPSLPQIMSDGLFFSPISFSHTLCQHKWFGKKILREWTVRSWFWGKWFVWVYVCSHGPFAGLGRSSEESRKRLQNQLPQSTALVAAYSMWIRMWVVTVSVEPSILQLLWCLHLKNSYFRWNALYSRKAFDQVDDVRMMWCHN